MSRSPQCYCSKKRRFRDKREAEDALHHIQNINTRDTVPRRVYRCELCKGYFLTKKPQYGDEFIKELIENERSTRSI